MLDVVAKTEGFVEPGKAERMRAAREYAYSMPIEDMHPGAPQLFRSDTWQPYFERLRKEAPIHFCTRAPIQPYWSVTRYNDIMHVDTNHGLFSSESTLGGITIVDAPAGYDWPSFISMDQPRHQEQRKTVQGMFTPTHLDELATLIRKRTAKVLDGLPRNETFNFVERVSVELTTQMLATLFDFPFDERQKLSRWSDVATAIPKPDGIVETHDQRRQEMDDFAVYFSKLWNERLNSEPRNDMISMMAHHNATRYMDRDNLMGNLVLLLVGGNDTTRNTMSGSILAMSENPDQFEKVRGNPALIDSMVAEVIRWQTPLAHMRRTALEDVEMHGKLIKKGDRVVMWYVSGNRDETMIERPNDFIVDRPRPRTHLSFGFGIHRCLGMRLAELQLKIVWEEMLKRFERIEVVGEPKRIYSSFIKGYETLPVRIPG